MLSFRCRTVFHWSSLPLGNPRRRLDEICLRGLWDTLAANRKWFESDASVTAAASPISAAFRTTRELDKRELAQFELAADLLIKVTGLERTLFAELQNALKANENGYANSIVDTVNAELAKTLNFPHWWSQDQPIRVVRLVVRV